MHNQTYNTIVDLDLSPFVERYTFHMRDCVLRLLHYKQICKTEAISNQIQVVSKLPSFDMFLTAANFIQDTPSPHRMKCRNKSTSHINFKLHCVVAEMKYV